MAQDKTDKTDETEEGEQNDTPTEAEIQGALKVAIADVAPTINKNETLSSGWEYLALAKLRQERGPDGKLRCQIDEEEVRRIVFRARGQKVGILGPMEPNPYAFDAACRMGGRLLRSESEMPEQLREFIADVLSGKIERSNPAGRPRKAQVLDLYCVSHAMALVDLGWLRLGENTSTERGNRTPKKLSAVRAVSDAFCSTGHYTTTARVKDVCTNSSYAAIQSAARELGLIENTCAILRQSLKYFRENPDGNFV